MSKKSVDKYFADYQKKTVAKKNGKGFRTVYLYTGTYYRLNISGKKLKKYKTACTLLLLAYIALFFATGLMDTQWSRTVAAAFQLLGLLPMAYMLPSLISLVMPRERFTAGERSSSLYRLKKCIKGSLAILVVTAAGNTVFLVIAFRTIVFTRELLYLGGLLLCIGLLTASAGLLKGLDFEAAES